MPIDNTRTCFEPIDWTVDFRTPMPVPEGIDLLSKIDIYLWRRGVNAAAYLPLADRTEWKGMPKQIAQAHRSFLAMREDAFSVPSNSSAYAVVDVDNDGQGEPIYHREAISARQRCAVRTALNKILTARADDDPAYPPSTVRVRDFTLGSPTVSNELLQKALDGARDIWRCPGKRIGSDDSSAAAHEGTLTITNNQRAARCSLSASHGDHCAGLVSAHGWPAVCREHICLGEKSPDAPRSFIDGPDSNELRP